MAAWPFLLDSPRMFQDDEALLLYGLIRAVRTELGPVVGEPTKAPSERLRPENHCGALGLA